MLCALWSYILFTLLLPPPSLHPGALSITMVLSLLFRKTQKLRPTSERSKIFGFWELIRSPSDKDLPKNKKSRTSENRAVQDDQRTDIYSGGAARGGRLSFFLSFFPFPCSFLSFFFALFHSTPDTKFLYFCPAPAPSPFASHLNWSSSSVMRTPMPASSLARYRNT